MSIENDQDTLFLAVQLLVDNHLVWDGDFDHVRESLAAWFAYEVTQNPPNRIAVSLAAKLVKDA